MRIWELLFLLTLALLPIQLGKVFFVQESFVFGIPIDYLSITIYLSQIVLTLLVVITLLKNKLSFKTNWSVEIAILIFAIYLLSDSIFNQQSRITGAIFAAKILSLGLFALIASNYFSKDKMRSLIKNVLSFSILWQSTLIILQFMFQRSLGLWILGERSFDSSTVNIAHIDFLGHQFLRPYGTFPHPNVAAAYLLILLLIISSLNTYGKIAQSKVAKIIFYLGATATILTFSKTVIVLIAFAFFVLNKNPKLRLVAIIIALASVFIFLKNPEIVPIPSVAERLVLIQSSLDLTLKNPLFGVGTTNFIRELGNLNLFSLSQTRLLQPVHNIFLLIMAENGLIGLIIFASILFLVSLKSITKHKLLLFIFVLVFGSIDHFFWTLHQGQLLLWLSFGFILSPKSGKAPK